MNSTGTTNRTTVSTTTTRNNNTNDTTNENNNNGQYNHHYNYPQLSTTTTMTTAAAAAAATSHQQPSSSSSSSLSSSTATILINNNNNYNNTSIVSSSRSTSWSSCINQKNKSNFFLGGVILFQWLLFTLILNQRYDREAMVVKRLIALESRLKQQKQQQQVFPFVTTNAALDLQEQNFKNEYPFGIGTIGRRNSAKNGGDNTVTTTTTTTITEVEGVFATILFKAPKWFHLRYKAMIDNAIINLPNNNWKVQLFINEDFAINELYLWHPSLKRIITRSLNNEDEKSSNNNNEYDDDDYYHNNKIIITIIPKNLTISSTPKTKMRPKDVLASEWFWNSMVSDHIVLFTGNGAFCGNHIIESIVSWRNLISTVDYCGVPFTYSTRTIDKSSGGNGASHSYRNRNAMLRVIQYYNTNNNNKGKEVFDDSDTVKLMTRINNEIMVANNNNNNNDNNNNSTTTNQQSLLFRLATKEQQYIFGGVYNLSTIHSIQHIPLVVSGTQPQLTYNERDSLLKHCPEVKLIFPSMHEPACFGAHPQPTVCKQSICALQDKIPSSGC